MMFSSRCRIALKGRFSKKRLWIAPVLMVLCLMLLGGFQNWNYAAPSPVRSHPLQTVTGNYHGKGYGTLDVQELPGSRIKFELGVLTNLAAPGGPDSREVFGVVPLHHGKAVYQADGGMLTMQFRGREVTVLQHGILPDLEGAHVGGTYTKRSSTPTFDN